MVTEQGRPSWEVAKELGICNDTLHNWLKAAEAPSPEQVDRQNRLAQNFPFTQPNKAWIGDITYIPTDEGWRYLAIVKDLCTKQIVGHAFFSHIDTNLTLAALNMAVQRRKAQSRLITVAPIHRFCLVTTPQGSRQWPISLPTSRLFATRRDRIPLSAEMRPTTSSIPCLQRCLGECP